MARTPKPAGFAEAASLFELLPPTIFDQSAIGAEGHRARMRARLLTAGPEALADHEMLEMALFMALPRRDTKPIAKMLLARFGGFGAVIAAPPADLMRIEGLGEAGTAALKLVQAAALRLAKGAAMGRPVLHNWPQVTDYLLALLAHEKTEQCRVLFLDNANRLIADELMTRGTIDRTAVYPRDVLRRALELHASAAILVHNHPSGETTPSRDDIAMTRTVRDAAEALGITLIDHLIVAGTKVVSFKQEGFL